MANRTDRIDTIVSLSKRRGLVYPSSEIYASRDRRYGGAKPNPLPA